MRARRAGKAVLVVEDDRTLRALVASHLREMGYRVHAVPTWSEAQAYLRSNEPMLALLDIRLPDADGLDVLPQIAAQQPVIVLTAYGTIENAVRAIKNGAAEFLTKPINLEELEFTVKRVIETATLRQECQFFKDRLKSRQSSILIGHSPAIADVIRLIDAVAPEDTTVLIQGESGAGKELVAREIHERSERRERNFVALDCCTLQESLFESELFGHERGAFTGADRQKKGLIEGAQGGTIFLDEIGEISPALQAKLLRIIETGHFRRLGGTADLVADARIVVATNRDLLQAYQAGGFRGDLYYRLNTITITVPPLRDRREDIPQLIDHFVKNHGFSRRIDKTFSRDALQALVAYDWPGNVRELRNVVERAIITSGDAREIGRVHLGLPANPAGGTRRVELSFDHEPSLDELKKVYIRSLLGRHAGHRAAVAAILGISERNTYRLLKKYSLHDEGSSR